MRRLLVSPALSTALFVLWVLLMQPSSPGTVVLGIGLALFWTAATATLITNPLRLRKPGVMAALLVRVVADMLRSNAAVAWVLLTRRSGSLQSGFVRIPLELRNPNGLAVLAIIVTFTPGTAWAQLSADNRVLLLHLLVMEDEASMATFIKDRYERPLREIFE
jgi:multicomponent K+:H+ antiporter subunit E